MERTDYRSTRLGCKESQLHVSIQGVSIQGVSRQGVSVQEVVMQGVSIQQGVSFPPIFGNY